MQDLSSGILQYSELAAFNTRTYRNVGVDRLDKSTFILGGRQDAPENSTHLAEVCVQFQMKYSDYVGSNQ